MWICCQCNEQIEDESDSCWKCSAPRETAAQETVPSESIEPPQPQKSAKWRLKYRVFRGVWSSWDALFQEAADFANELGPERVVSISHSEDKDDGVVAVWFWSND